MNNKIISEDLIQELRVAFCSEASDHLDALESLMLSSELKAGGSEVGRLLHSLKGGAHSADFGEFGLVVHELEDIWMMQTRVSQAFANFLLKVVDRLRKSLRHFECGDTQRSFDSLRETRLFVQCSSLRFK